MRGLPGSGKSYFAQHVLPEVFNVKVPFIGSADHFFTDEAGNYDFDPKGLPEAHRQCREKFFKFFHLRENSIAIRGDDHAFNTKDQLVIVDNTNTTPTEIAFYYDLATIFTKDVEILTVSPPTGMDWDKWLEQCHQKNQHGVPMKSIKDMGQRLKNHKLPWYWREKVVTREDGFFTLNGQRYDVVAKTSG
jgi:hypothetical protein